MTTLTRPAAPAPVSGALSTNLEIQRKALGEAQHLAERIESVVARIAGPIPKAVTARGDVKERGAGLVGEFEDVNESGHALVANLAHIADRLDRLI